MILVTILSFLTLRGNEFSSFESTFVRLVKKNSSYFANEIFLEQTEALDLRIQEIISTAKDQYPNAKICLEVNSIHVKNATPRQIAFRCHQDISLANLAILHEIKLGGSLVGNIKYALEGEGLMENKLFRFIIIALVLAMMITFLAQRYFGKKFTDKFFVPLVRKVVVAESEVEKYNIMKKLVHDSEAFIVVLENLINKKKELSKEEKSIGMESLSRIRLLNSAALRGAAIDSQREIIGIKGFLENVLAEKKIQFQNENLLKLKLETLGFDYFVRIEQVNLMRAFSNLIDNAVEAMDKGLGTVTITLNDVDSKSVEIAIRDNGKGIPSDILNRIQINPFSYDKTDGNGLGLKNAIDIIKSNNGSFKIESELGMGTTVFVTLPFIKKFEDSKLLYLNFLHDIVILDDTIEIHETWKNIFNRIDFPLKNLHFFSRVEDFKNYCDENKDRPALFFFDYDLGPCQNGFDLVKEFSLVSCSFLVTSYSNDISLIENCERNGVKVIPKKDIGNIQFKKLPENYFVHLDDSRLLRKAWIANARDMGVEILSFGSSANLFDNLARIAKETRFFIDKNLNENIDGLEVAKKLFELDYRQIFLSTADDVNLKDYDFIKNVVRKDYPSNLISKNDFS